MAKTVFDVLKEQISAQRDSANVFLQKGSAKDYAAYREVVGLLRGLDSAENIINDLAKAYIEEDMGDD